MTSVGGESRDKQEMVEGELRRDSSNSIRVGPPARTKKDNANGTSDKGHSERALNLKYTLYKINSKRQQYLSTKDKRLGPKCVHLLLGDYNFLVGFLNFISYVSTPPLPQLLLDVEDR